MGRKNVVQDSFPIDTSHRAALLSDQLELTVQRRPSFPYSMCVRSCLTFCSLMDCSLPGSSVHGISQAVIKNLPANAGDAGDAGSIPGSERSPGVGNGSPLQYFVPGKLHGQRSLAGPSPWGAKSQTRLSTYAATYTYPFSPHFPPIQAAI